MRARPLLSASLLLAAACAGAGAAPGPAAAAPEGASGPARAGALSPEGRAALRALVGARRLEELSWDDVRGAQEPVRRFYEGLGWELAWTRGALPTPEARALARALQTSADDGLEPRDYDGPDWEARLDALETPAPAPEPERVRFDVLLTVSAVRYLADLNGARTAPASSGAGERGEARGAGAQPPPPALDPAAFLRRRLVESADPDGVLADAQPPHPAYARTLRAFRHYRQLARATGDVPRLRAASGPVPGGAAGLSLGRWLWRLGDLEADAEPRAAVAPAALARAVTRFQRRHGLEPSGQLDPRTVRALDVPLARRAEQLGLALERWRSLPRRPDAPPVVVSLPKLRVRAPDAAPPLSLSAVAGPACDRLAATFASEIVRVVLRPASRSAPGVVEFVFPNPHAVTLAGTAGPPPRGRARPEAARGCLQVERADELATWVLRDEPLWDGDRVRAALEGGTRTEIPLGRPAPVLVVYATAAVGDDGEVLFLDDARGGDAALAQALAREEARRARGRAAP